MHTINRYREPDMRVFTGHDVNRLFVYGTLKKTYGLHWAISTGKFVGEDTLKGFLFAPGHTGFPVFVPDEKGMGVMGEVYEWPKDKFGEILAACDQIEGVPGMYWRLPFETGLGRFAWAYWQPEQNIRDVWKVMYTGRFIGKNSPVCDWRTLLQNHPSHRWPTKPRMRYQREVKCVVVDQKNSVGTAFYLPAGLDHHDSYKAFHERVRESLKAPAVEDTPKEEPPKLVTTTSMGIEPKKVSNGN